MNAELRILDASANRCREGLRVLEDYVRFGLDLPVLTERLKRARHELTRLLTNFTPAEMLLSRDTTGDVGTQIELVSEQQRFQLTDVLQANCKRVQESLRSLEEYSKLTTPETSRGFEQLRYEMYVIEQQLLLPEVVSKHQPLHSAKIYLLFDPAKFSRPWEEWIKTVLSAGVDVIQLRNKSSNDRDLLQQAKKLRELTAARDKLFIMNDRPDLARLSGADGVHVGQEELTVASCRKILGPSAIVGLSTHSVEQAEAAIIEGADYIGVGPVFASETKTFHEFPGLKLVESLGGDFPLPWFPIGGIDLQNLGQVVAAGARRIAVGDVIQAAVDPVQVIDQLREILSTRTN